MNDYAPSLALAVDAGRRAGAVLREEFHWPGGRHVGVIDPNDGTTAYLQGWRGSAVSVAALRDGIPILGVVFAFAYPDGGAGDLIAWAEGCPLTRNGVEVRQPTLAEATLADPKGLPPVVFVSRHADGGGPEAAYAAATDEAARPDVQEAVRKSLAGARHAPPADYSSQMGWVLIALQNAFYQLLHAPSLEEGVVDTVLRGGDTDTNGAIAGALLGAVHGRDAVPARWRSALLSCRPLSDSGTRHPMPQEFWPVDALLLAEALLTARDAH